jgi:Ca-activated chloride channel homolog
VNTLTQSHRFKSRLDIVVGILALAALMLLSAFSQVLAGDRLAFVTPNDMQAGSLLLKSSEGGKYLEAPRVATDFNVTISGPTARTVLTQRFENPANGWVEGVYVFPLPENSAVDTLKIIAGNRVIVGEVKERREAKIIYEEAKASGQAASLLEQERPNMFTNSVANIGPGETVIVQIEYQETIKQSSGVFSLRLPLVVAPRYSPEPLIQSVELSSDGFAKNLTDAQRITPPVLDPKMSAPVNLTTITISLNAGFALGDVKSLYHSIKTDPETGEISLGEATIPADKDFALEWKAAGPAPQAGLFTETVNGKDYLLGFVTPPSVAPNDVSKPRETIFVIDNSGSMEGPSMVQAKESLIYGLSQMKPGDLFNVVRFDDTMEIVFPTSVSANKENLDDAIRFVSGLAASGGTEMVPAMAAALRDMDHSSAHLRQVVFLTDGAIGNEQQLFATITGGLGRSRVFMVGIGSAPNSYLMTRAAELGRGTFTHIGDGGEVTAKMQELFNKIGSPVVTELKAELLGNSAQITPDKLPDLYLGEPVLFMAEGKDLTGTLKISGNIGNQPWEVTLPIANAAKGNGISKLCARRKIADYEVASTLGGMTYDNANKAILDVALTHQIVSSQTSLVAVDKTPKRPAGERLSRADVPLNLPAGWNYESIFGEQAPAVEQREASAEFMQLAVLQKPAAAPGPDQQVMLPQTATPAEMLALMAVLLMLMGLGLRMAPSRHSSGQM